MIEGLKTKAQHTETLYTFFLAEYKFHWQIMMDFLHLVILQRFHNSTGHLPYISSVPSYRKNDRFIM